MAISPSSALQGSCTCGRNTYIIEIPPENTEEDSLQALKTAIQVIWNGCHPPTLRTPLPWYHSTTHARFFDETHSSIRRSYTHPSTPSLQRHFCGFCGVRVSEWKDGEEREWIFVDMGSLQGESLVRLEGWGISIGKSLSEVQSEMESGKGSAEVDEDAAEEREEETSWFDRIVMSGAGGRVNVSRGTRQTGGERVEWEIVEWTEKDDDQEMEKGATVAPAKRKLENVEGVTEV